MKTWKTITIIALTLAIVGATVATAYAYCWGGFGPRTQYNTSPIYAPATTTQTSTQYLQPVTQTNTQVPTLYTPPIAITAPAYSGYGSWGGCGCMGRFGYGTTYPSTTATPLTITQATQIATTYVASLNNTNLNVVQIEEYSANFYVQVDEQSTGYGAFQLLINKVTGIITPEFGPNMMWNTKYTFGAGYCNWFRGTTTTAPTVTLDQAKTNAQQYLNTNLAGTTVGDVTTFYGYYNVEVLNAGTTYGMLSVNAYTGQVWYHTWHGPFIQELQVS